MHFLHKTGNSNPQDSRFNASLIYLSSAIADRKSQTQFQPYAQSGSMLHLTRKNFQKLYLVTLRFALKKGTWNW